MVKNGDYKEALEYGCSIAEINSSSLVCPWTQNEAEFFIHSGTAAGSGVGGETSSSVYMGHR